jgi:hypothetical protein
MLCHKKIIEFFPYIHMINKDFFVNDKKIVDRQTEVFVLILTISMVL